MISCLAVVAKRPFFGIDLIEHIEDAATLYARGSGVDTDNAGPNQFSASLDDNSHSFSPLVAA